MVVMGLSARRIQFVNEYLVDFNASRAARAAGYSEDTAGQIAHDLLKNIEVQARIEERKEELAASAGLSREWVLNQWRMIAQADPNELIWNRIECCRHCYGFEHRFQWTEHEYFQAVEMAQAHRCGSKCSEPCKHTIPPDCSGGFGFTPHKPPVANCPLCHGDGYERQMVADTRRLTGSARRLYAGLKKTKDGIEIKMRDQDGALASIAKYLGMIVEKRELGGPGGGPIPIAALRPEDLSDEQLAAIIAGNSVVIDIPDKKP